MSCRLPVTFTVLLAAAACSKGPVTPTVDTDADTPRSEPLVYRLSATTLTRQPLTIVPAAPRALRAHFAAPARVAFDADATVHVGSPVRGRIAAAPIALGALVRADDVLAVVDSPELGEAQNELLLQHHAAVATAPLVALGKQSWERGQQLFLAAQSVAEAEVRRREAEYLTLRSAQSRAEAAAKAARNRLQLFGMDAAAIDRLLQDGVVQPHHALLAPIDGQVVERRATRGDQVGPDQPSLLTIVDPGVVWVLAEVPEARVGDVVVGSVADVRLAHDAARTCTGTVTFLAPRLDPTTRTAQARIVVPQPPAALRPGMFCEVRLTLPHGGANAPQPLCVPEAAVQVVDRRTVVFVPNPGDATAFTLRAIDVGAAVDGFVPVLAGLQAGETVVADGSFVLKAQATQVGPDQGK